MKRTMSVSIVIVLFLFSGCSVANKFFQIDKDLSKGLFQQIVNDSKFGIDLNHGDIRISPIEFEDTNSLFLVDIRTGTNWEHNLWIVDFDKNQLIGSKKIDAVGGNVIKKRFVSLSQGNFIEFYNANNTGNGNVILISLDDLSKPQYEFNNIIDSHIESFEFSDIVSKHKLTQGIGYSFVYAGGFLESRYIDVDGDGNTDAVFSGIQEFVADNQDEPVFMYFIKKIYIYNPSTKSFLFDETKSIYNDLSRQNDSLYE